MIREQKTAKGRDSPEDPCIYCRRYVNCKKVCHYKKDWLRGLKKRGKLHHERSSEI